MTVPAATQTDRVCSECAASIADRKSTATTCGRACRKARSRRLAEIENWRRAGGEFTNRLAVIEHNALRRSRCEACGERFTLEAAEDDPTHCPSCRRPVEISAAADDAEPLESCTWLKAQPLAEWIDREVAPEKQSRLLNGYEDQRAEESGAGSTAPRKDLAATLGKWRQGGSARARYATADEMLTALGLALSWVPDEVWDSPASGSGLEGVSDR